MAVKNVKELIDDEYAELSALNHEVGSMPGSMIKRPESFFVGSPPPPAPCL